MSNPIVTVVGRVGNDPEAVGSNGVRFRVATSDSKFNSETNKWEDGPTSWWTIKAWRNVADNAKSVIKKGQEVIIVGAMYEDRWTDKAGVERNGYEINAKHISVTSYSLAKNLVGAGTNDGWDMSQEVPF